MGKRRKVEAKTGDDHDDVIAWYRDQLEAPAEVPWAGTGVEPVRIGPTWATDDAGRWVLPDASLGWDALGWCGTELQYAPGEPWRFTLEQARIVLWWYAVDEAGRFLYRDAVLQRLKGWGKDPLGACLLYLEALGPCRFAGWDGDRPVATDVTAAWCQTAAVALEQTKNTMRLMPGLLTPEAEAHYRVQVGKELIHAEGDSRLIQALTSSPKTLQGARSTFVLLNETHEWDSGNGGHDMAGVIDDNATKSPDGAARTFRITNAYEPGGDSVAQRDREAFEKVQSGEVADTGVFYDSLEAPPDAPLTAEAAHDVIVAVRGDSVWLGPDRIVQRLLDVRNPPSRARRFWYNQVVAAEDAWVDPAGFDACRDTDRFLLEGDELVVFFDGSKSDDATALVGCRVSDGHVFTLGMWQRPPGLDRSTRWTVPRRPGDQDGVVDVDTRVTELVATYRIRGLWADPSHADEDVTGDAYWDGLLDEWHARWATQLDLWAQPKKHSIIWDMASPRRTEAFTQAAMRVAADIDQGHRAAIDGALEGRPLTHDGDGRLVAHVRNARRRPNRYGVSIGKANRESPRKIDLAVSMVGARMMRRQLELGAQRKRPRSGVVW